MDEHYKYKFDVTVSFAGEDRDYVENIVWSLRKSGVRIFYDLWEQADLWGKDLYQHLDLVYRDSAKYCLIFVSKKYIEKAWTRHELKSAQARSFNANEEYILPILLDQTPLPGLPPTVGYLDASKISPNEICQLFLKKLRIGALQNETTAYPFEYEYSGMEVVMLDDGSFEIVVEQNVISHQKSLRKIQEKVNLSGDSTFLDSSVSVDGSSSVGKVNHQVISDSDKFKLCNVTFQPELNLGDRAHYFVKYRNSSGFIMVKEEIEEQINKGQWPFDEPFEYTSFGVKYPAKVAMFKLIFPKGFEVSFQDFWGVSLDHSYEPWETGMKNVISKGSVRSYNNENGQLVFELIDNEPKVGANYFFKWRPPTEANKALQRTSR